MYEYVCKRKYAPYRKEVEKIIRHAQQIMRKKYNTTIPKLFVVVIWPLFITWTAVIRMKDICI